MWLTVLAGTQEMDNVSVGVGADGSFSASVDLDEGTFDLRLTCRDGAGNMASTTVSVTVDTTPPDVAISSPGDGTLSRGGSVHVIATADADARVMVNGMPVANDGSIDHFLFLGEGENVIRVTAVDAAGNSATDSITVTVDSIAPTVTITSPQEPSVTIASQTIQLEGTVTGDVSTLTVNGQDVTVADGDFSTIVTLTEEGATRVPVVATDAAGNYQQVFVTVDAFWTPPTLEVDMDKESEEGKAVVTCTVTGDCVGLLVVHTSTSGETTHTVLVDGDGTYVVVTDLEKGDNTMVVRALDDHGGFTESESLSASYQPAGEEEEEAGWGTLEVGAILLALGLAMVLTVLLMGMWRGGKRS
jgi:nitrogen fixation protein FixH